MARDWRMSLASWALCEDSVVGQHSGTFLELAAIGLLAAALRRTSFTRVRSLPGNHL